MKKTMKKLFSLLLIAILIMSIAAPVFAAPDPGNYKGSNNTNVSKIENLGNNIISIVSTAGSVISVVVLIVLGIKYMMGSAEEKAEYKKTLLPYIIGAALVFAASFIASVVFNFASSMQ